MARLYGIGISIRGYAKTRVPKIEDALEAEWNFQNQNLGLRGTPDIFQRHGDGTLYAYGESSLVGGEEPQECANRLATAVFRANRRGCDVFVDCTCLEDLPHDDYCFDKQDYRRLVTQESR